MYQQRVTILFHLLLLLLVLFIHNITADDQNKTSIIFADFNAPCIPEEFELGAYDDVFTKTRTEGDTIVELDSKNLNYSKHDWTIFYEDLYIRTLYNPAIRRLGAYNVNECNHHLAKQQASTNNVTISPTNTTTTNASTVVIPQNSTEEAEANATKSFCNLGKLLRCYVNEEAFINLTINKRDIGRCGYDRFHTIKNHQDPSIFSGVTVGFPCEFRDSLTANANLKYSFIISDGTSNITSFKCGPLDGRDDQKEHTGTCTPLSMPYVHKTYNYTAKLKEIQKVSGIKFVGLGLQPPLKRYLVRFATHVCACPAGFVPNTRGSCLSKKLIIKD